MLNMDGIGMVGWDGYHRSQVFYKSNFGAENDDYDRKTIKDGVLTTTYKLLTLLCGSLGFGAKQVSGVETAETKRAQNNENMFARKFDCQDGWK